MRKGRDISGFSTPDQNVSGTSLQELEWLSSATEVRMGKLRSGNSSPSQSKFREVPSFPWGALLAQHVCLLLWAEAAVMVFGVLLPPQKAKLISPTAFD